MTKLAEQIKQGADQAWESLSDGWRELSTRASGALTRFWPSATQPTDNSPGNALDAPPQRKRSHMIGWAFLAADVFESADTVTVRIEAPGMRREDFNVALNGDVLTVWGEKHIDRELADGQWRVVQSAYGNFRRDVVLPVAVQVDKTKASYRDGVLRIELPKSEEARPRRIAVQTAA
ncbi:MAG: Hsp20/alpha crystallin family protein [Burkholderiales bacterium]|nr:Hsp20/alpha crystallin family protein [Burkholderiales bacterium]